MEPRKPKNVEISASKHERWFTLPYRILKDAIALVPPVKYALAVLGVMCVLVIIKGFRLGFSEAISGAFVIIILMYGILLFATVERKGGSGLLKPAFLLLWSVVGISVLSAAFLFSIIFFGYPTNLPAFLSQFSDTTLEDSIKNLAGTYDDIRERQKKGMIELAKTQAENVKTRKALDDANAKLKILGKTFSDFSPLLQSIIDSENPREVAKGYKDQISETFPSGK